MLFLSCAGLNRVQVQVRISILDLGLVFEIGMVQALCSVVGGVEWIGW